MRKWTRPWIGALAALSFTVAIHAETLDEAVSTTVHSNPRVLRILNQRLASGQTVKKALAGFLPVIGVAGSYGFESTKSTNTGFSYKTLTQRTYGISAVENVFNGFGTINEVGRTQSKTDADAYELQGQANDSGLLAADAFLNIMRNRQLVILAKHNLKIHRITYSMIHQRSESGIGRAADVTQSYARLELAKANLVSAQSNLHDAIAVYHRVVGHDPMHLVLPKSPRPADLPRSETEAVDIALDEHPLLKEADADVAEARFQYKAAKSTFYPHVNLVVEANQARDISGTKGPNNNYLGIIQANYNIYRGGADLARVRETHYQFKEAIQVRDNTERQVIENMRLSWNTYVQSRKRLRHLRKHMKASSKVVVAYREQFKLGKRTLLDLLDSENELFRSQQSYVIDSYQYLLAKYRILNGMGDLLGYLHVMMPVEAIPPYLNRRDYTREQIANLGYEMPRVARRAVAHHTVRRWVRRYGKPRFDPTIPTPKLLKTPEGAQDKKLKIIEKDTSAKSAAEAKEKVVKKSEVTSDVIAE